MADKEEARIHTVDSITKLDDFRGDVLIAGSHGGVYAGYLAAKAGLRGVILNDAGIGKDAAGIASLPSLDTIGLAATVVGHDTARIGDGADMADRGIISHVNGTAAALGCAAGQSCMAAAEAMRGGAAFGGEAPPYGEGRFLLRDEPGEPQIWGCDSASLVIAEDAGRIIVTASHGGVLAGRPDYAIAAPVLAALFNDAGIGIDGIGITRLPLLDDMGIAGGTVAADSARIGDARSSWETGRLSHVNRVATASGAEPGMTVPQFCDRIIQGRGG